MAGEQPGDTVVVGPTWLDVWDFAVTEGCEKLFFKTGTKSADGIAFTWLNRCAFSGCAQKGEGKFSTLSAPGHVHPMETSGKWLYFEIDQGQDVYRLPIDGKGSELLPDPPHTLAYDPQESIVWGTDVLFTNFFLGIPKGSFSYGLRAVSPAGEVSVLYAQSKMELMGMVSARDASTLFVLDRKNGASRLDRLDRSSGQVVVTSTPLSATADFNPPGFETLLALPGSVLAFSSVGLFQAKDSDLSTWTKLPDALGAGMSSQFKVAHGRVYGVRQEQGATRLVHCPVEDLDAGTCVWTPLGNDLGIASEDVLRIKHDEGHVYVHYRPGNNGAVVRIAR